jgi:hypothetical protein
MIVDVSASIKVRSSETRKESISGTLRHGWHWIGLCGPFWQYSERSLAQSRIPGNLNEVRSGDVESFGNLGT